MIADFQFQFRINVRNGCRKTSHVAPRMVREFSVVMMPLITNNYSMNFPNACERFLGPIGRSFLQHRFRRKVSGKVVDFVNHEILVVERRRDPIGLAAGKPE